MQGLTPPAVTDVQGETTAPMYRTVEQLARDRLRTATTQMRCWQGVALWALLLAMGGLSSTTYLALRGPQTQWVVLEVTEAGELRHTTYLPEPWRGPTPALIEKTLQRWITALRWVPTDGLLQSLHFQEAATLLLPSSLAQAKTIALERLDLRKEGKAVSLEFRSLLPMDTSLLRWHVEWFETTFVAATGVQVGPRQQWKAILTLELMGLPELEKAKKPRSTLGIFIRDFHLQPL